MKPNKEGKYRINFYLNPENSKDNIIIEYLNQRYSATDYIKEILYDMAYGMVIPYLELNAKKIEMAPLKETYEKIEELDEIEL